MLHNFYTYLFFSAMLCGLLMTNLVSIVRYPDRKKKLDALLHLLLMQALLAVLILIAGVLFSNVLLEFLRNYGLFFILSFAVFFTLFFFLRNYTLLLSGVVLLILAVFCQKSLKEFETVSVGFSMDFMVLRSGDERTIEMVVRDRDFQLLNVGSDTVSPCIIEIHLSPYLFFMPSETYIRFCGFVDDPNQLDLGKNGSISIPRFLYSTRLLPSEPLPLEPLRGLFYRYTKDGWEVTEKKENISKITG